MPEHKPTRNDAIASSMVATLRQDLDLTQLEFANALNVNASTIAKWESNNPAPGVRSLLDLADFAKVHHSARVASEFKRIYADSTIPQLGRYQHARENDPLCYVVAVWEKADSIAVRQVADLLSQMGRELRKK